MSPGTVEARSGHLFDCPVTLSGLPSLCGWFYRAFGGRPNFTDSALFLIPHG